MPAAFALRHARSRLTRDDEEVRARGLARFLPRSPDPTESKPCSRLLICLQINQQTIAAKVLDRKAALTGGLRSTFARVKFLSRLFTALNLLPSMATLAVASSVHCPRSASSTKRLINSPIESRENHSSGTAFSHSQGQSRRFDHAPITSGLPR
jgi:hypothetical protein